MIAAARHLKNCYDALSDLSFFYADILREESKSQRQQYHALFHSGGHRSGDRRIWDPKHGHRRAIHMLAPPHTQSPM